MKKYRIIFTMMFLLSLAILAGCAGSLPQQTMKFDTADVPIAMEFIFIKGGCYQRVAPSVSTGGSDKETPAHEVCVSDFYLSKYEVTQNQWKEVMGNNPSGFQECGINCPVENISWDLAQEYIKQLNAKSGKVYRLPTEAEWEYAARSGGKNEKWAGANDEKDLEEIAWYIQNSGSLPHRVGLKKANGLGLHDMSGNVAEWCQDFYSESYYSESQKDNPSGPATGERRVLRGGTTYDDELVRVDRRHSDKPGMWDGGYGLRLVLPVPAAAK